MVLETWEWMRSSRECVERGENKAQDGILGIPQRTEVGSRGEKETNEKGMLWSSGRRQLHGGQGGQ